MAKARKKSKPAAKRRENVIRVTATDEQKELIAAAAEKAGSTMSSWLLGLGLSEARRTA